MPRAHRINSKSSSSVMCMIAMTICNTRNSGRNTFADQLTSPRRVTQTASDRPGALLSESLDRAQNSGPGRPVAEPFGLLAFTHSSLEVHPVGLISLTH